MRRRKRRAKPKRTGMVERARSVGSGQYGALIRALATRVVELRQAAELTQDEAAHRADVDIRTWQRVEAGEVVQPTLLTLARIAGALGVEPWELLRVER